MAARPLRLAQQAGRRAGGPGQPRRGADQLSSLARDCERLAEADPGNSGWQRDLSVSHNKLGDVQVAQGNLAAALTSFQASLAICERLAEADPGNSGWQRDLSVSHDQIGDVQVAQGNLAAALTSFQASLAISERLAEADPGNSGWQRDLSVSHEKIGDVQVAQGNLAAALTSFQASLAIARAAGRGRPRQFRMAARPLRLARPDRRRAGGPGQPRRGADQLSSLARDCRAAGRGRPRQFRMAARPLRLARQDRRRAGGPGQPRRGADQLSSLARDLPSGWPRPTPAIPDGSATSPSRTTRSGDVQVAQGNLAAALTSFQASLDDLRAAGRGRPRQFRMAARPLRQLGESRKQPGKERGRARSPWRLAAGAGYQRAPRRSAPG